MFDCGSVIWLWQGWLEPDEVRPNEATVSGANTGSGKSVKNSIQGTIKNGVKCRNV